MGAKKNDNSLIYIVNDDYKLVYFNTALKNKMPNLKIGDYCYNVLACKESACPTCPLDKRNKSTGVFYNPVFKSWYDISTAQVEYSDEICNLILADPMSGNANPILDKMTTDEHFDALVEISFDEKKYRLISEYKNVGLNDEGDFDVLISKTLDMIDDYDKNKFKNFVNVDTLRNKLINNTSTGVMEDFRIRSKAFNSEWLQLHILPINIHHGSSNNAFCFVRFVDTKKYKHAKKEDISIDYLTSLPRGASYLVNVKRLTDRKSDYALVAIDIEHFKMFNEWYSTTAGDIFLKDIANVLRDFDRRFGSYSGYFGDDNYCILIENRKELIIELEHALVNYVKTYDGTAGFMPSLGVYVCTDNKLSASQMYDRACIAVSRVKGNYTSRICYYNDDMLTQMQDEHNILHDVLVGIKNKEFVFYLQPQYNMYTGKIFAAEALVRWVHDGKLISPGKFIPILEKTSSITDLDKYIWEEVIKWQKSLIIRGIKPLPVSVNVSRMDLYYLNVSDIFITLVNKYHINPSLIEIEITESAYIQGFEKIKLTVETLQNYGFRILMDDFGSGYSSLNMLKNINVDVLKMDMRFLDINDGNDEKGINILESIVNMIKIMNLPIITEGVETDIQRETLKDMGCQYAQGYLFYKPMPISQFEELLKNPDLIDYNGITNKRVEQVHVRELLNENLYSDTLINNILGAVAFFGYNINNKNIELVRVNERYYRLFGSECTEDTLYRQNVINYFYEADREKLLHMFEEAYENRLHGVADDIRYVTKDGIIWVHARLYFLNESNNNKMYYCSFEDITIDKEKDLEVVILNRKLKSTLKLENIDSWELNLLTNELTMFNAEAFSDNTVDGKYVFKNFPDSLLQTNVVTQEHYNSIKRYIDRIVSGHYDEKFVLEMPIINKNRTIHLQIKGRPIYDDNNNVVLVIGSYRDVTNIIESRETDANNKALEILNKSAVYSMYANITQNTISSTSGDLGYEIHDSFVNEKDFDLFFRHMADNYVHPDDKMLFMVHLDRDDLIDLCKDNQTFLSVEYRRYVADSIKWRRMSIYLSYVDNNVYANLFVSDIDDLKAQRNQLNIVTNTLESLNCGVIRIYKETKEVVAVNQLAANLLGFDNTNDLIANIQDGYISNIYPEDKIRLKKEMGELKSLGDSHNIDYRVLLPNGDTRYLFGNEILIEDGEHNLIIQRTIMDNTEEKKLEHEVLKDLKTKEINALKLSNENKAIIMGINNLFVASLYCNIPNNSYNSMKKPTNVEDLDNLESYDEYISTYSKNFVHKSDRKTFNKLASRANIKNNLSKEKDRFIITYRRLFGNEYKWYKVDIILSSLDYNGHVENFIFAISDIDKEIKEKENIKHEINYYKDLFFTASRDVYLGMTLINLDTLETNNVTFEDDHIKEAAYSGSWDKLSELTFERTDLPFRKQLIEELSVESLRNKPVDYVKTLRYRINLSNNNSHDIYWLSSNLRIIEQNGVRLATLFTMNITDEIQALELAKYNSERDGLTGLYNRVRLVEYQKNTYPNLNSCAVIFFDIDNLKITNDTLGHKAGDLLIKVASKSIKSILNENSHAYRYGGDEFIVIVDNATMDDVNNMIEKWKNNLILYNEEAKINCNMSVGYAYSDSKKPLDSLIILADQEMYKAKLKAKFTFEGSALDPKINQIATLVKRFDEQYTSILEIDLVNDEFVVLHVNQSMVKGLNVPRRGKYSETINVIIDKTTDPDYRNKRIEVSSIEYLKKNISTNNRIVFEYLPLDTNKKAALMFQGIEFDNEVPTKVILVNIFTNEN